MCIFAVFENVVLVAVKAGAGRSVQEVALGPFAHGDDAEIVIEAEAGAQNFVQKGHDLGVDPACRGRGGHAGRAMRGHHRGRRVR